MDRVIVGFSTPGGEWQRSEKGFDLAFFVNGNPHVADLRGEMIVQQIAENLENLAMELRSIPAGNLIP